jgi:hypothetical protein
MKCWLAIGAVTFSSQPTKFVETSRVLKHPVILFSIMLTVSQSIKSEIIYKGRYKISVKLQYLTSTTNQIHGLGSSVPPESFNLKFARVFGVSNRTNKIQHKITT